MKKDLRTVMSRYTIDAVPLLRTLLVLGGLSWSSNEFPGALGKSLDLTVLHVNDIHVRFEETNTYGGTCKAGNSCYGGLSRLLYKVNELRGSRENTLFLNGGDFYQGNIWYSHFKWRAVVHFGNILNFTAMALGNHEFDDRIEGLVPLLNQASFPIICANIDSSAEERLRGKIPRSTVVTVQDRTIGIIGYVTKETDSISRPGRTVGFIDEVEAIDREAKRLKASGADILIALGHSGYEEDKHIAKSVPLIDLVVGGHSHSFLYSTRNGVDLPSREKPQGDYPTIVTQPSGKTVPVVQAFAYTKYLGVLNLKFNEENKIVSWNGAPILLDESIPEDTKLSKEMVSWKEEIDKYGKEILGRSDILLLKSRSRESNLGDLICDSMVHYQQSKKHDVYLSLMNSGGIRGSFQKGNITREDLLTVLPFQNLIDIVKLKGIVIHKLLEKSVERLTSDSKGSAAGFLQVSGFKLKYDLRNPSGSRLVSVLVKRGLNSNDYVSLTPYKLYNVAVTNYMTAGGDGYRILEEENEGLIKGVTPDQVVMSEYIAYKSPINEESIPEFGERIVFTSYSRSSAPSSMLLHLPFFAALMNLLGI